MDTLTLLSSRFLEVYPDEAARVLERHPADAVARLLVSEKAPVIAGLLGASIPVVGAQYLGHLPTETAAQVMANLSAETAARLLRHMDRQQLATLLDALPTATGEGYKRLLQYPEGTAGSLMDPFVFVLPEDLTVAEAMRRVRERGREAFYFPYVVDRNQKLAGILTVRELMLASPRHPLAKVMRADVVRLRALATGKALGRLTGWRTYQSLPVVDEGGVLIGVIRQDALRQLETGDPTSVGRPVLADSLAAVSELYFRSLSVLVFQMAQTASAAIASGERGVSRDAG